MLNFTTRPHSFFGFTARYRHDDRQNLTPMFDAREYVRFDAVPEEIGGEAEQYNIRENLVDLNATFNVAKYAALRLGYGDGDYARTGRVFGTMADNTFRVSVDSVGSQFVTLCGIYEYSQRRGGRFNEEMLVDSGSQPALRFYDEANRRTGNEDRCVAGLDARER